MISWYKTNITCLYSCNSKNISLGQILTDPFHSATPREIEKSKFDLVIYFLLSTFSCMSQLCIKRKKKVIQKSDYHINVLIWVVQVNIDRFSLFKHVNVPSRSKAMTNAKRDELKFYVFELNKFQLQNIFADKCFSDWLVVRGLTATSNKM